jgi:hypothetical protein
MSYRKMGGTRGRLNFIFPHMVCFSKNTASYLRENLVFMAIILKKWNLSTKNTRKMRKVEPH